MICLTTGTMNDKKVLAPEEQLSHKCLKVEGREPTGTIRVDPVCACLGRCSPTQNGCDVALACFLDFPFKYLLLTPFKESG